MISVSLWLLLPADLLIRIAILAVVIPYCRRQSHRHRQAARLLLRAVACQIANLILFSIMNGWMLYLMLTEVPLTDELARPFVFKIGGYISQALEIATWLFIAWAVVMRPDDTGESTYRASAS